MLLFYTCGGEVKRPEGSEATLICLSLSAFYSLYFSGALLSTGRALILSKRKFY